MKLEPYLQSALPLYTAMPVRSTCLHGAKLLVVWLLACIAVEEASARNVVLAKSASLLHEAVDVATQVLKLPSHETAPAVVHKQHARQLVSSLQQLDNVTALEPATVAVQLLLDPAAASACWQEAPLQIAVILQQPFRQQPPARAAIRCIPACLY
jgi:hypothetical protein